MRNVRKESGSRTAAGNRAARTILAALTIAAASSAAGLAGESHHATLPDAVELGSVAWGTDLDAATKRSAETGRPVFLLFQEVPGCRTCVDFGRDVLEHALIVEAIETEFVPVAVRNNVGGREAEIRSSFREPACNFPVVRFLGADGSELLPRRDRIWSAGGVVERMTAALEAAGRPVPAYLSLLRSELATDRLKTTVFAMGCYWEGEAQLGAVDGVVLTRAVWSGGSEAVEVTFDPDAVEGRELARRAEAAGCRVVRGDGSPRTAKESDQKYSLARSELRGLALTPAQATKVNAALRLGRDPLVWLSPRQCAPADPQR
ncbi:MAG TPA: VPGUxxT family thioredoxin-like (seleno)protein, type 2 [bacterium]|nr:VPGUxxT family thioredoxin-like (seleno)protein, type 2 [bacterium]